MAATLGVGVGMVQRISRELSYRPKRLATLQMAD
jgi:hypothetical protein